MLLGQAHLVGGGIGETSRSDTDRPFFVRTGTGIVWSRTVPTVLLSTMSNRGVPLDSRTQVQRHSIGPSSNLPHCTSDLEGFEVTFRSRPRLETSPHL